MTVLQELGDMQVGLQSCVLMFFFSSRRRHTRFDCDWSSDVCSSDLGVPASSDPARILVAGCGTGQNAIAAAKRFSDASVLAIDFSRASLAYAMRKTREIGRASCRERV